MLFISCHFLVSCSLIGSFSIVITTIVKGKVLNQEVYNLLLKKIYFILLIIKKMLDFL